MKKVILSTLVASAAMLGACTSTQQGSITEGDSSVLDSLSYALGTNVGASFVAQMSDIPFDFDKLGEGVEASAFGKNTISHDEAVETLQQYFTEVRPARAQVVEASRAAADSVAMANGATAEEVAAKRAALVADADMFESEEQREAVSYALGIDLGENIKMSEIPVQIYWLNQAIADARDGKSVIDAEASMAFLQNYFTVVRPAELQAISEENLAKVEKMSGVVKTESGLMYRIEKEGDKEMIAKDDRDAVKVHYTGRLLRTDKVFDTSRFEDRSAEQQAMLKEQNPEGYDKSEPIEFPLNRVIPGWTEGMKLVGKGGRISLWIPAELAYGANGAGRDIGPNEALYFDVEILDVIPFEAEVTEE